MIDNITITQTILGNGRTRDLLCEVSFSPPVNEEEEIGRLEIKMEFDPELKVSENRKKIYGLYESYCKLGLINGKMRGCCTQIANLINGEKIVILASRPFEEETHDYRVTHDPLQ